MERYRRWILVEQHLGGMVRLGVQRQSNSRKVTDVHESNVLQQLIWPRGVLSRAIFVETKAIKQ